MNPKYILGGLIITVAVLFAIIYATMEIYLIAVLSLGLGGLWLAADARFDGYEGTLFFLAFAVLAVIASLNGALTPLPLLGMSLNLAAWDIARFLVRLNEEKNQAARAVLEARHWVLLTAVIGLGFLIALLPLSLRLAIPFVIVGGVALLALLALQQSMSSLSRDMDRRS